MNKYRIDVTFLDGGSDQVTFDNPSEFAALRDQILNAKSGFINIKPSVPNGTGTYVSIAAIRSIRTSAYDG